MLIMQKLKLASLNSNLVRVMPFIHEPPHAQRVILVNTTNKKVLEELKPPSLMTDTNYKKIDSSSWIESHKRSMHAINQDPTAPILLRHFIAKAAVRLKVYQKKGSVMDRFDAVGRAVSEVFKAEKYVAKTSGRVVKLAATRGGRWMKDFLEKQILVESKGYDERERMYSGDGEADPNISTGYASSLSTISDEIETADVLYKKNIYILKEQYDAGLHLVSECFGCLCELKRKTK